MANVKELLQQFGEISQNPNKLLKEYIAAGDIVIGCLPIYTPQPLVHAAGMVPFGLWGSQCNPQLAGKYAPIYTCSILRSCLEFAMAGKYDDLSGVLMPIICDTFRGFNSAWRAGVKNIRPITFIYPQNRNNPGAADFLIEELKVVAGQLEEISGTKITNDSLQASLLLYNRKNALMREFCALANEHLDVIGPVERHRVMKAVTFMKVERTIEMMTELNAALRTLPVYNWTGKKVVLTGITCEPETTLQYFANCHVAVVGDDLAQESRQYRTDYPSAYSAIESLAMHWLNIRGCSVAHDDNNTSRGDMLVELAHNTGADCVVVCMMRFCDIEEYDQPAVIDIAEKAGLMAFSIDIDQSTNESGQALTKIQAYSEN